MNKQGIFACLALVYMGLSGCASSPSANVQSYGLAASESPDTNRETATSNEINGRLLVWNAYLSFEVDDVKTGLDNSRQIAEKFNGYIESSSGNGESSGSVVMKIPAASFQNAITLTQGMGHCTNTRIVSQDVTDQFVDVQARLKSKIELRERLRKLLERAAEVKDVIAIETELTRLQGEIESMESTVKRLQGQVDYGTINLTFERKTILGPVGLVFKGVWWGFKKLFVIRD